MGGECGTLEVLVGKPDGKGHLENLVADVRITLNAGIRWDGVDWIQVAWDKHKLRTIVNTINLTETIPLCSNKIV